jgi:hypothetical protein
MAVRTSTSEFLPGDPATHVLGRPEEKPARRHRPPPPKPAPNERAILADIQLRMQMIEFAPAEYKRLKAGLEAIAGI